MATEVIITERTLANSKLRELFVEQLQDLYWAEKRLIKTLGKMQDYATTARLKDAFQAHLVETSEHVNRLEAVFASINEPVRSSKCPAMAGIIDEANDLIDDTDDMSSQRDAALIIAAQKAEHYEIASYGSLAQIAEVLNYLAAKELLGKTLEEEKTADALLTEIARSGINYNAALEEETDDDLPL